MKKIDTRKKIIEARKKELKKEIFSELFEKVEIPEGCELEKGKFKCITRNVVEDQFTLIIDELLSLLTEARAELEIEKIKREKKKS